MLLRSATLSDLGLTEAVRADFARALGDAFRRVDRLGEASRYLRIALESEPEASSESLRARLRSITTEMARRATNDERRPRISESLDQPQLVRPRIPPRVVAAAPAAARPPGGGQMRWTMRPRVLPLTLLGIALATAGALLQTPAQPARPPTLAAFLPGGASLVLQAPDFSSVLADWNGSPEKAKWLDSENFQAFSRSQLFLRLSSAYEEFATAAGVPVDLTLVSDVAGAESALALYGIGKLEFLYVTRMPAAKAMENVLWRARGDYETREAAGTPFYVRTESESERTVAFGVRDGYLLLATREDLMAGALANMDRPGRQVVRPPRRSGGTHGRSGRPRRRAICASC